MNTRKMDSGDWFLVIENRAHEVSAPAEFIRDGHLQLIRFGKWELENAARTLVLFFDHLGGWREFTLEQLAEFCKERKISMGSALFGVIGAWFDDGGFGMFRSAAEPPYIMQINERQFAVTSEFIKRLEPKK